MTEDPEALASALSKISGGAAAMPMEKTAGTQSVAAMMIASPFSAEGFSRLFSTHPPIQDRIARLMQMGQEMRQQGVQSATWPAVMRRPALPRSTFDRAVMTGRSSARSMVPLTIRTVRVRRVRPVDIRATIRNAPCAEEGRADAPTASRAAGSRLSAFSGTDVAADAYLLC